MSPYFSLLSCLRKGILSNHDFLVPSGSGMFRLRSSGACLPTSLYFLFSGKGFCSIMISWFLLIPARIPGLVSPAFLFIMISWFLWFRLGFRGLSPYFSFLSFLRKGCFSIMISWFVLVPAWVPGLVSRSFWPSGQKFCSILFHFDFLVPSSSG